MRVRRRGCSAVVAVVTVLASSCGTPDTDPEIVGDEEVGDDAEGDEVAGDGDGTSTAEGPPSVVAVAGDRQVRLARGGYCWSDASGDERCRDAFGVVTSEEVLEVAEGGTIRFEGPFEEFTLRGVGGNVYEPSDAGPEQRGGSLVWTELTSVQRLADVELSGVALEVPAGRYVLELKLDFEQGEVSYATQLEVS